MLSIGAEHRNSFIQGIRVFGRWTIEIEFNSLELHKIYKMNTVTSNLLSTLSKLKYIYIHIVLFIYTYIRIYIYIYIFFCGPAALGGYENFVLRWKSSREIYGFFLLLQEICKIANITLETWGICKLLFEILRPVRWTVRTLPTEICFSKDVAMSTPKKVHISYIRFIWAKYRYLRRSRLPSFQASWFERNPPRQNGHLGDRFKHFFWIFHPCQTWPAIIHLDEFFLFFSIRVCNHQLAII